MTRGLGKGFRVVVAASLLLVVVGFSFFAIRSQIVAKGAAALKDGRYSEAASKLNIAASMGDSNAQFLMGDIYALGWGVPEDDIKAMQWYRRAAIEPGAAPDPAAPAMYYIGKKFLGGQGIPRDENQARKWLERSAQGGYPKAAEQLARLPDR